MESIEYAIKIEDKFVVFAWDYKMEWEDVYKDDLHEAICKDILFEDYAEAKLRMDALIKDLHEFAKVDEISVDDIGNMRIVKVEKTFSCKVIELD